MRGRNSRASTIKNGRQYATGVDGTVISFECERHGHTYKRDFGKGPVVKRLGETACRMMARWWTRERGGCIGECPKCERAARQQAPSSVK